MSNRFVPPEYPSLDEESVEMSEEELAWHARLKAKYKENPEITHAHDGTYVRTDHGDYVVEYGPEGKVSNVVKITATEYWLR